MKTHQEIRDEIGDADMGMFDNIKCEYPLPVEGANDLLYQTKSLDCFMDLYVIRADGTLWHEEYDVEDRSDPNAKGLMALAGCATRVNKRLVAMNHFTGEIRFDDWSAYFVRGMLKELHQLE